MAVTLDETRSKKKELKKIFIDILRVKEILHSKTNKLLRKRNRTNTLLEIHISIMDKKF